MKNKLEKIKAFLVGLVVAFFALEISLQAYGFVNSSIASQRTDPKANTTILCLGNSHTAGEPLGKEKAYPRYLQSLLNKRREEKKFRVINKGIANLNSAELLNQLREWIKTNNPDLIILRTGEPNFWNYYRYNSYLQRRDNKKKIGQGLVYSAYDLLYNLRTFRFLSVIVSRMNSEGPRNQEVNQEEESLVRSAEYDEAVAWLNGVNVKSEQSNFTGLSLENDKVISKIETFKETAKENPRFPGSYSRLGNIYELAGRRKKAANYYIKGIKADHDYRGKYENRNYCRLRELLKRTNDKPLRKYIKRFIGEFSQERPRYSSQLRLPSRDRILNWIESDINEIIDIIQQKNLDLIIQNYQPHPPSRQINDYHPHLNQLLRETARQNNVTFVDNEGAFRKAWREGKDYRLFYAKISGRLDRHPSAYGQKFTARNIYEKLKQEGLLNLTESG